MSMKASKKILAVHLISTLHDFSFLISNTLEFHGNFFKSEEIHPSFLKEHPEKVCNCNTLTYKLTFSLKP